MVKYYTGIGSRETPQDIGDLIEKIALKLEKLGYTLRSGGAKGADSFFENKVALKDIYIPWKNFNNREAGIIIEPTEFSERWLNILHPAYNNLTQGAKKLHTRNINQVLGTDLKTPSKFLICWAEIDSHGIPKGGTRTAWVLAQQWNIPCFNLNIEKDLNRILKFIDER